MIYSDNLGKPCFNLDITERLPVIEALFKGEVFTPDGKEESIQTMYPGKYTRSKDNKRYAKTALTLLRENDSWSKNPLELWVRVIDGPDKKYNYQMDVVIALWSAKKFVGQS